MSDGLLETSQPEETPESSNTPESATAAAAPATAKSKPKTQLSNLKSALNTDKAKSPLKSLGKSLGLKKKKKKDKDDFDWDDPPLEAEPRKEGGKESAEWSAFKEMQERINANLQKTQQNLTKLEKTTSVSDGGVDAPAAAPAVNWEHFDDEEGPKEEPEVNDVVEVTPNIELGDRLSHLCVSPVPSPAHQPGPPQNSRRASVDDLLDTPVTNGGTCDLLGLDSASTEAPAEKKEMSNVFSDDLLGLNQPPQSPQKPDHPDSGLSSGVGSPGAANNGGDIFDLGPPGPSNAPDASGSSVTDSIVDDFLGLTAEQPVKKKAAPPRPAAVPKVKPARPPPPKHGSFSRTFSKGSQSSVDDASFDPLGPKAASAAAVPVMKKPSIPEVPPIFESAKNNDDDDLFKVPDMNEILKTTVLTEGADGSPKVQLKSEVQPRQPTSTNPFAVAGSEASGPVDLDIFASGPKVATIPVVIQAPSPSIHSSQEDDAFDPRNAGESVDVTPVSGDQDVWAAAPVSAAPAGEDQTDFFDASFPTQPAQPTPTKIHKPRNTTENELDESLTIFATPRPRPSGQSQPVVTVSGDLFGDSSTDALFGGQAEESQSSKNPFATAAPSMNPFADGGAPLVTTTEAPDFDAIFGAEDAACAFKAVGGRSGSDGQVGLGVFDPFQTIHPTSSDEHPVALGNISDEEDEKMVVTISAEKKTQDFATAPPLLPPPSKHDNPPRFNPFDKDSSPEEDVFPGFPAFNEARKEDTGEHQEGVTGGEEERPPLMKTASEEREELEMALPAIQEDFHPPCDVDGWEMLLRQPLKKRLTQNRFWKKCFVRLIENEQGYTLKIYENRESKDSFHELMLQPSYQLASEEPQQYDAFGKLHTVKITYVFYKERVGVKAERLTPANIQNLVRQKPKATMILDHAPQVSELLKFGTLNQNVMKSFVWKIEDVMMRITCFREKTLTYAKDEVSMEVWDEYENELDITGHIVWQQARIRCFCLCFITGMPTLELGINDLRRKGKEIVGRHDIMPIRCDEWIRIQLPEFHHCVDKEEFEKSNMIRYKPLDACQFEVFRFRISLRPNWELPLQIRIQQNIVGRKVEIRADLLICGYYSTSSKDGQVPCEDIEIRIPLPECWIYMFRVEKGWRYGSIKSATRKPGKIKGLERITMLAAGFSPPSLMEVAVGQAKYEHIHRSIVWRIARLPERHHGAYKSHLFTCRLELGPHDELPDVFEKFAEVYYSMPNTTVSRTAIRSISSDTDDPPEKWVRYVAKYKYKVEIDHTISDEPEPELRIGIPRRASETSPPDSPTIGNPPMMGSPPARAPQAMAEDDRDIPLKSPSSEDED